MSAAPAERLEALFHAALETPAGERSAFLDRVCDGDAQLRAEVEALLDADSRAELLIDQPALGGALRLGARAPGRTLPAGQRIGSYELVRVIGAGGMGTIYEAVQDQPRRTVALKLLRASFATPVELRRFEHEVELLGRLQHPNIARIYEAGVHTDELVSLPYFAMERIADARHLLEYARGRRPALLDRLRLFLKICDAVQHGHQRGVVHRDLKPSNILVDAAGEPRVIDYGVARALDADMRTATVRTNVAEFVGTLQYMAPEQLRADPAAVDTRCDIYALGLILFELLTGRRPFDLSRASWTEAIRIIETTPLPSAAAYSPELRGDLATIIAKAGEKDRERRYASVGELAEDIRRYLSSEPISARPPSLIYHARKFAGRHRAFVAAVGISMLSILIGAGVAGWKAAEARAERARAEREARRIGVAKDFMTRMLAVGDTVGRGPNVSMLEAIDAAATQLPVTLAEDPQMYGDLRAMLGQAYMRMRRDDRARPHLQAAVQARRVTCGDPSDGLAHALVDLAWVGCPQTLDEQVQLFRQAIDMYERVRGPDAPIVAAVQSYLAGFLDDLDRADEAERTVRQALERLVRGGQVVSDKYAYAQMVLGDIVSRQRRFAEAEQAYRTALALQYRTRGPGHRELAGTLRRLARLLERTGRRFEATALWSAARRIEPHTR